MSNSFLRPEAPLTEAERERVFITGGFAHPDLTAGIAEEMGAPVGQNDDLLHPNGEIYARIAESIRGRHVFVVQPHAATPEVTVNDSIIEQGLLLDAAQASSASQVTAVSPYLSYVRQDRRARSGEAVGTRFLINLLARAGANRIVTVDVHQPAAEAVFNGPFDQLTAKTVLREELGKEALAAHEHDECLVIAPDAGAAKAVQRHSEGLGMEFAFMPKNRSRTKDDGQRITRPDTLSADVDGRACLIFDDMIDTAGTLVSAVEKLKDLGANGVYVAATHGVFSDPALQRLQESPIDRLLVTDTLPVDQAEEALGDKLRVVSSAPLIGQALLCIFRDKSVSSLFQEDNFS